MIKLEEVKIGKKSIYKRIHLNNNQQIFETTIFYRLFSENYKGAETLILYDDDMNVVLDAFKFINIEMSKQSFNSREKAMYSLRIFYCFLALTKTDINNLTSNDISNLRYFLLGYSPNNGSYSLNLVTVRSNSTVNSYLNIYRSYTKYSYTMFFTLRFITIIK